MPLPTAATRSRFLIRYHRFVPRHPLTQAVLDCGSTAPPPERCGLTVECKLLSSRCQGLPHNFGELLTGEPRLHACWIWAASPGICWSHGRNSVLKPRVQRLLRRCVDHSGASTAAAAAPDARLSVRAGAPWAQRRPSAGSGQTAPRSHRPFNGLLTRRFRSRRFDASFPVRSVAVTACSDHQHGRFKDARLRISCEPTGGGRVLTCGPCTPGRKRRASPLPTAQPGTARPRAIQRSAVLLVRAPGILERSVFDDGQRAATTVVIGVESTNKPWMDRICRGIATRPPSGR